MEPHSHFAWGKKKSFNSLKWEYAIPMAWKISVLCENTLACKTTHTIITHSINAIYYSAKYLVHIISFIPSSNL